MNNTLEQENSQSVHASTSVVYSFAWSDRFLSLVGKTKDLEQVTLTLTLPV